MSTPAPTHKVTITIYVDDPTLAEHWMMWIADGLAPFDDPHLLTAGVSTEDVPAGPMYDQVAS